MALPEGVGISPASARGAAACSDGELRLGKKGPALCPDASKIGQVKVETPLLDEPIEGDVYLLAQRSTDPESGEMGTGGKARLQNTFRVVPDAPVERFELTVRGGKDRGLLVNSTDLCCSKEQGVAVFTGQNGKESRTALRLVPSFKGCGKVRRQAARKLARKKAARKAPARRAQLR